MFEKGNLLFLPDDDQCFLPARAATTFEQGKAGVVILLDGERQVRISAKHSSMCQPMDKQSLRAWPDMVVLKQLDNASLLHNIRMRYMKDEIFTSIGSILISMNPYKQIPDLFGPESMEKFIQSGGDVNILKDLGPHIYGVAEDSYSSMMNQDSDQSCIVTGESGAGKTEATKLFLAYIAERSRRNQRVRTESFAEMEADGSNYQVPLREQILGANPIMEAFGNAKTVRNDNSSRFGKLIDVHFNRRLGVISGGGITNYLLEKSRVVRHLEGERSYHVFYQICAAATTIDPDMRDRYQLFEADQFFYLNQSAKPSTRIDEVDDCSDWQETVKAMKMLKITDEQREQVCRTLAGILHLGNLEFAGGNQGGDTASVQNTETLHLVATLFGVEDAALEAGLLTRDLSNKMETVIQKHNVREASDARDALAKHTYSRLFDFLSSCINSALSANLDEKTMRESRTISVLDIFGFESFGHNSMEQLCINYCNEKLQGFFNNHIFKLEQEEYRKEAIDVSQIGFSDNQRVLDTIDDRSFGIFAILDDEVGLLRGSDDGFLTKVISRAKTLEAKAKSDAKSEDAPERRRTRGNSLHQRAKSMYRKQSVLGAFEVSGNPLDEKLSLKQPDIKTQRKDPTSRNCFIVVHFAGPVMYNADGFLEKNRDILRTDIIKVVQNSSIELIATIFDESVNDGMDKAPGKNKNSRKTLGRKFQEQLDALMSRLSATEPHFVRTIKPNTKKASRNFYGPLVMDQCRFAGLLEVCRIRQLGYPIRKYFLEFFQLYGCIKPKAKNVDELLEMLKEDGLLVGREWQKGKTKVFMRAAQAATLEEERAAALWDITVLVQCRIRLWLSRNRFLKKKNLAKNLERGIKERNVHLLETNIAFAANEVSLDSKTNSLVIQAKRVLGEIKQEQDHLEILRTAVDSKDIASLPSLIQISKDMGLGDHQLVKDAEQLLWVANVEQKVMEDLEAAIESKNTSSLRAALSQAEEHGLSNTTQAKTAKAMLNRMEEIEKLVQELEEAINAKDTAGMQTLCNALGDLGEANHPMVQKALKITKKIVQESKRRKENLEKLDKDLAIAIANRDLDALNELRTRIEELGADSDRVREAMELRAFLEFRQSLLHKIAVEMGVLGKKARMLDGLEYDDLEPLDEALAQAEKHGLSAKTEPEIQAAIRFRDRMEKQLLVQDQLEEALASDDYKKLDAALLAAQALGMETEMTRLVADRCRKLFKVKLKLMMVDEKLDRDARLAALKYKSADEQDAWDEKRLDLMNSDEYLEIVKESTLDDRFELEYYYRIRSDDDYTSQFPSTRRNIVAEMKLQSTTEPIFKSLTEVDELQNGIAVRVNETILRYCGDLSALQASIAGLSQFVLLRGLEDPRLGDEIYVQLMKHIRANTSADSLDKAWLLMCACTKYFPPTPLLRPYLIYFLNEHTEEPHLIGNYAKLCLAQLSSTIAIADHLSKACGNTRALPVSKYKPSLEELAHYRVRPPVLCPVQFVDLSVFDIPASPDMLVESLQKLVKKKTGVFDAVKKPSWAIFVKDHNERTSNNLKARLLRFYKVHNPSKIHDVDVYVKHWKDREVELFQKLVTQYGAEPDIGTVKDRGMRMPVTAAMAANKFLRLNQVAPKKGPSPKCSWPLPWWLYVGDVYLRMSKQGLEPSFVYKRRFFPDKGKIDVWLYQQLTLEVTTGILTIAAEDDVAELAAISFALEHGGELPDTEEELVDAGISKHIPQVWLEKTRVEKWAAKILQDVHLEHSHASELRDKYGDICGKQITYGMCFFSATAQANEKEYVIGVNSEGVHILNEQKNDVVKVFPMKAIKKFGAQTGSFWMKIKTSALKEAKSTMKSRMSRRFTGANGTPLRESEAVGPSIKDSQSDSKFSFLSKNNTKEVIINIITSWELYDLLWSYQKVEKEIGKR